MKKVFFAVMAMVAVGLTSCGNKTQQGEAVDSAAVIEAAADEAATGTLAELTSELEAGDASRLQQTLESIKAKVAELIKNNPEVAKQYVAKVQNFLKENAEKVKTLVGDNAAVAAAVSAITEAEPESIVSGLLQQAGDAVTEAKDSVASAAQQKVDEAKDAAQQKAEEAKDAAKQKAGEAVDAAADKAKKALGL